MSTAELIPIEEIQTLLPRMDAEQTMKCLRLVKFIQQSAPVVPQKPISVLEMVNLESNLAEFFKAAWRVIEPGRPLLWSWHYELLAEYLTLVARKQLRRLIINVPPRTAKSNFVTMCFPAWMWLQNPAVSFLFASYSNSLSTDHSVMRRNLIQSQWYQSLWGDKFQLASDRNLTTQYSNDKMGQMISTSTGSGAEGRGGDIAILDDPMSSQQALSDTERLAANKWISNTLKQRLNDPATASIIVIMQRLHELDTTGFVIQEDPGVWQKVEIPLVAEKDEEWVFPISGRIHRRSKGDVLQPERFTPGVVAEKQANRLVYAGQYQQHPAPLEGNLIKRSEVKYHSGIDPVTHIPDEPLPEMRKFHRIFLSVDASFKEISKNAKSKDDASNTVDYCCVGVIGVIGRKRMILDVVNEHLDVNGLEGVIKAKREQWKASAVIVEDKANGPAVVQRLKNTIPAVIEVTPEGGKIARMFAATPEWQAGDWYVDRNAAWSAPFVDQITQFPTAKNDDQVDMMTQASIWLQQNKSIEVWARLG